MSADDPDLCDDGLQESLAYGTVTALQGFAQLGTNRGDLLFRREDDDVGVEHGFKVVAALSELDHADAEGSDALVAEGLWHGAGFEGGEVSLDRFIRLIRFGLDDGEFFLVVMSTHTVV